MIKNRNILIVGATGGIGSEVTRLLVRSEANVFITGRDEISLRALAVELGIPSERLLAMDLRDMDRIEHLKTSFFKEFPVIDILINCSGIGILKPVDLLTREEMVLSVEINLIAPFMLLKAFLPAMKKEKKGLIIHIPGVLAKSAMTGGAAYSASKYGLMGMIQSVREEVKRTEIRFTNIIAGGVNSPFWDEIDLRVQRDKMITAGDVAKTIWFLCQQPSSGVVNELVLQPFNHQVL